MRGDPNLQGERIAYGCLIAVFVLVPIAVGLLIWWGL